MLAMVSQTLTIMHLHQFLIDLKLMKNRMVVLEFDKIKKNDKKCKYLEITACIRSHIVSIRRRWRGG